MFNCCGCPSKKANRQTSEDEDEEKEKEVDAKETPVAVKETVPEAAENGIDHGKKEEKKVEVKFEEEKAKAKPEVTVKIEEPWTETPNERNNESEEAVTDLTQRKSSLRKPKPRLSISTEVKIIPDNFEFEEEGIQSPVEINEPSADSEGGVTRKGDRESPLSDEVFAGAGFDPPRANMGVSLVPGGGVEFPRSPHLVVDQACGLDVPSSPRVKVPTPHPVKRGSMPAVLPRWLSEEEDEGGGAVEPPVTPVAKDELALRRHRFFSELLSAAQAATEHRVRFDPLGPEVSRGQSTLNMSAQGFQDILRGPFTTYLQLSNKIGGDVAEHAKVVEKAFQAQLQYLVLASQCKKPAPAEEGQLLQPTSQHIQAIQEFREKHRTSPLFNHLSAISESIPALGWVTISPAPSPFVKEMNDAGQFYTNRVLKDWKEKDKTHVEWTKAWVQTLSELQGFVKQHHTTGLVWSGTGSVPARGGPPPPPGGPMPPPPPPLDLNIGDLDLDGGSNDRSALFAEINRGSDVTKGLKKVTSDMQTHKNPGLRSGPAPFKAPATAFSPAGRAAPAVIDKPPTFTRDGKKWLIEYQKGNNNLVVEGAEMNNVVYAFRCQDSTITVKGKINSIFLDSCKKTAVVFDSVVSSVEFVNCQSVQMQVLGAVPTISIDKTDGCQMYLSDGSLGVEVISSKSSEMNILVPKGNGDFTEFPVPEQFRTSVSKKGLTTTAVESTG